MDDRQFDDPEVAWDWIRTIESDGASVRDGDVYPRLRAWMERVAPRSVLDVGAGQGVCSARIDLEGRSYTGLEPSPVLVERARALHARERCRFVEGNVYAMPFADGSFDAVFSIALWHLLGDLARASAEVSRVLAPGGRLLLMTANPAAYASWTAAYTRTTRDGSRLDGVVERDGRVVSRDTLHLHPLEEILAALEEAGLDVGSTEDFRGDAGTPGRLLSVEAQRRAR